MDKIVLIRGGIATVAKNAPSQCPISGGAAGNKSDIISRTIVLLLIIPHLKEFALKFL
jgi:uncharacterized membrane protein